MAKPNFSFQKRQKEIARQKKKEEKKQRKLDKASKPEEGQEQIPGEMPQEGSQPAASEPAG